MRGINKLLFFIGFIGLWIFMFHHIGLAVAKEQDYPTKPITLYIAFAAGGTTDLSFRSFANVANKYLTQPIVPINKLGGAGTVAAMAVMNAKPDGYTLATMSPSTLFVAPHSGEAPYKDLSGFTLIVSVCTHIFPLIVKADAPWKTWQEFIDWARKNPRGAKIGITGAKSVASQGLVIWQIEQREKVEFTCVQFRGGSEVLSAILGGHITMYGSTAESSVMPYIEEGKLRILAYMSKDKVPGYESFPSTQELYGFSIPHISGIYGPKGLSDDVLKKLDDTFVKVVKDPDYVKSMKKLYTPILYMNRVQVNKWVEDMFPKVGEIMKNLKAEEAKEKR